MRKQRTLLLTLAALALVYAADLAYFHIHVLEGDGVQYVTVDDFLKTPLKGQREGYDYIGPEQKACAKALFPHAGLAPCWWVRRHTAVWE